MKVYKYERPNPNKDSAYTIEEITTVQYPEEHGRVTVFRNFWRTDSRGNKTIASGFTPIGYNFGDCIGRVEHFKGWEAHAWKETKAGDNSHFHESRVHHNNFPDAETAVWAVADSSDVGIPRA